MEKVLSIPLKPYFTANTLGCHGLNLPISSSLILLITVFQIRTDHVAWELPAHLLHEQRDVDGGGRMGGRVRLAYSAPDRRVGPPRSPCADVFLHYPSGRKRLIAQKSRFRPGLCPAVCHHGCGLLEDLQESADGQEGSATTCVSNSFKRKAI